jgi:DNA-binding LacI/PurR family transcriptional regulator
VPESELASLEIASEDVVPAGAEAMRRLETATAAGGGVDAVVCTSDSLALGALTVVGRSIPIIGYDNTPIAASLGFSSVEQPLDEVAAGVLELLTGVHGGRVDPDAPVADPRHRLIAPRLVVRSGDALVSPS